MRLRASRLIAAIGILAILLNAFVPGLARALAPVDTGAICSAKTSSHGAAQRPELLQAAAEHCPYCAPHAASYGAPPPSVWRVDRPRPVVVAGRGEAPPSAAQAPQSAAQPRAPPFLA